MLDAIGKGEPEVYACEVLGADALLDQDELVARERWEQALAVGSTNPAVLYELCEMDRRELFHEFDMYYRLPDETAAKLRGRLTKLGETKALQSWVYELLAWVEGTANHPNIANINLVQRNMARVKEKNATLLLLSVCHMRLNDAQGARAMLDSLDKANPSG